MFELWPRRLPTKVQQHMAFMANAVPKRSHHARKHETEERSKSITDFFSPPPKAGRPRASVPPKKRGPPPAVREALAATPDPVTPAVHPFLPTGKRAAAALLDVKLTRVNWGRGEGLQRMTQAINDWDNKTGCFLEAEKTMPLPRYAELVSIPFPTLAQYVCSDLGKRKVLGKSVGKQPLFSADERQFGVDVIRIHDRGNDGLNKREAVDKFHDMRPDLKRQAVAQAFDRTVRPQSAELTGIIKANPTTVKRTAITVPQQYRWHMVCVPQCLTVTLLRAFHVACHLRPSTTVLPSSVRRTQVSHLQARVLARSLTTFSWVAMRLASWRVMVTSVSSETSRSRSTTCQRVLIGQVSQSTATDPLPAPPGRLHSSRQEVCQAYLMRPPLHTPHHRFLWQGTSARPAIQMSS